MRPGDCELINEIHLELREQLEKLSNEYNHERAVDISIVIDNLAEAEEHVACCRKMIYEDKIEGMKEK